ncbi:hypothetical protein Sjap_021456 [Stephania japonica]|uniref:Uncharacterized protein n=1 Tax=Stephania japonica TaxID=461633 RepID=A0AAP0EME7_9MAGN
MISSGEIPQCRHPRSRSFSSSTSSSSSSSGMGGDSPFSPISSFSLAGIPFSWEQHPGIPKKSSTKNTPNKNLILHDQSFLPLPPPKKFDFGIGRIGRSTNYKADPFVAALMKCSRENLEEDQWSGINGRPAGMVSRGLKIDRYMLSSCKSSCGVVEPIAVGSRPASSHRSGYSLIRKS